MSKKLRPDKLSLLLSEVAAGHVGHMDEKLWDGDDPPVLCEPCGACFFDVLSSDFDHPIDAHGRPGCLEPDCVGYRACTIEDILRYLERHPL